MAAGLREWVLAAYDEDLELILKAAVKVKASHQRVDIEGTVPVLRGDQDLVTIARTSGCMLSTSVALVGPGIECVPSEREQV